MSEFAVQRLQLFLGMRLFSFDYLLGILIFLTVGCGSELASKPSTEIENETEASQSGYVPLTPTIFKKLKGRSYYLTQAGHTCRVASDTPVVNSYLDHIQFFSYQQTSDGVDLVSGRLGDKCNDTQEFIPPKQLLLASDFQTLKFNGKIYQYLAQTP